MYEKKDVNFIKIVPAANPGVVKEIVTRIRLAQLAHRSIAELQVNLALINELEFPM